MTNSFFKGLISDINDLMERVRLNTMWDAINPKKNYELINMDMMFIDEKVLVVLILIFFKYILFLKSFHFQIAYYFLLSGQLHA